jgi:hypothetical protein
MKKVIMGLIIGMLLMTVGYAAGQYTAQKANFKVFVNGNEKTDWGEVPPLVVNGRTMLPLKSIGDSLGVNVRWDGQHNRVIVGKEPKIIPPASGVPSVIETDGVRISILSKYQGEYMFMLRIENISDKNITIRKTDFRMDINPASTGVVGIDPELSNEFALTPGESKQGYITFNVLPGNGPMSKANIFYKETNTVFDFGKR